MPKKIKLKNVSGTVLKINLFYAYSLIIDEHTLTDDEVFDYTIQQSKIIGFKVLFIGDMGQYSSNYDAKYTTDQTIIKYYTNHTQPMKLQQRGGIVTIRKLTNYFRDIQELLNTNENKTITEILALPEFTKFGYQEGIVNGKLAGISVVGNMTDAENLIDGRTDVKYIGLMDSVQNGKNIMSVNTAQGSEAEVIVLDLQLSASSLATSPLTDSRNKPVYKLALYAQALLSASGRAKTHLIIIDSGRNVFSNKLEKIEGVVSVFKDKLETRKDLFEQGIKTFKQYDTKPAPTTTAGSTVVPTEPISEPSPTPDDATYSITTNNKTMLDNLKTLGSITDYTIDETKGTIAISYANGLRTSVITVDNTLPTDTAKTDAILVALTKFEPPQKALKVTKGAKNYEAGGNQFNIQNTVNGYIIFDDTSVVDMSNDNSIYAIGRSIWVFNGKLTPVLDKAGNHVTITEFNGMTMEQQEELVEDSCGVSAGVTVAKADEISDSLI